MLACRFHAAGTTSALETLPAWGGRIQRAGCSRCLAAAVVPFSTLCPAPHSFQPAPLCFGIDALRVMAAAWQLPHSPPLAASRTAGRDANWAACPCPALSCCGATGRLLQPRQGAERGCPRAAQPARSGGERQVRRRTSLPASPLVLPPVWVAAASCAAALPLPPPSSPPCLS